LQSASAELLKNHSHTLATVVVGLIVHYPHAIRPFLVDHVLPFYTQLLASDPYDITDRLLLAAVMCDWL
jgi:hypothetical protein